MIWHVLPVNDLHKHKEEGLSCLCNPKIQKTGEGDTIVVHNSYDMREYSEEDRRTIRN